LKTKTTNYEDIQNRRFSEKQYIKLANIT